jgi:hypothetical protein
MKSEELLAIMYYGSLFGLLIVTIVITGIYMYEDYKEQNRIFEL